MSAKLQDFVSRLLERHGALVEVLGEDSVEALLPGELAGKLGLDEMERLSFTESRQEIPPGIPPQGPESPRSRPVSLQGDFLEKLGCLVPSGGILAAAELAEPPLPKPPDLEHAIARDLVLENAVIRGVAQEEAHISWLIFHLKYSAVSDEQREGMVSLAVNEWTGNIDRDLPERVSRVELAARLPPDASPQDLERSWRIARRAARSQIHDRLADFTRSMNRRFRRDQRRIADYFGAIVQEIRSKISRKRLEGEERDREEARLRAADLEEQHKIRDLEQKYDLSVRVEPVAALRLHMPAALAHLNVMRRKHSLPLDLAWNPLSREMEPVLCQGCHRPSRRISICDDKLHRLCPRCCGDCDACHRPYCRACRPAGCPRCPLPVSPPGRSANHNA